MGAPSFLRHNQLPHPSPHTRTSSCRRAPGWGDGGGGAAWWGGVVCFFSVPRAHAAGESEARARVFFFTSLFASLPRPRDPTPTPPTQPAPWRALAPLPTPSPHSRSARCSALPRCRPGRLGPTNISTLARPSTCRSCPRCRVRVLCVRVWGWGREEEEERRTRGDRLAPSFSSRRAQPTPRLSPPLSPPQPTHKRHDVPHHG